MRLIVCASVALAGLASQAHAGVLFANKVENFTQGQQRGGALVDAQRSDADKALGAPQNNDTMNFVSLGLGGKLTLSFGQPFTGPALVIETTYGNPASHPEAAEVFVGIGSSWDTAAYYSVGLVLNTADTQPLSLDSAIAASGSEAFDFIRIEDRTGGLTSTSSLDGFDVDGVSTRSIPAPGAAVLGLAGLAMLRRRRA